MTAHRALAGVLRVAALERLTADPGVEVGLRRPARVHEEGVAIVGGAQELECLEAGHLRDLAGPFREPLDELVGPLGRDLDRVDAHHAHVVAAPKLRPPTAHAPLTRTLSR